MSGSPYEAAAKSGDVDLVRALLNGDVSASRNPTSMGVSPVLVALYYGHENVAREIALKRGLDLFEAAALGDEAAVSAVLPGSNVNTHSGDGFTALGYAAYFGHLGICKTLLRSGADPNLISRNGLGVAPHHSALAQGFVELAKVLLDLGADVNLASKEGWTALHYAAYLGNRELAEWLLLKGATRLSNSSGKTPEAIARDEGHTQLADYLAQGRAPFQP